MLSSFESNGNNTFASYLLTVLLLYMPVGYVDKQNNIFKLNLSKTLSKFTNKDNLLYVILVSNYNMTLSLWLDITYFSV